MDPTLRREEVKKLGLYSGLVTKISVIGTVEGDKGRGRKKSSETSFDCSSTIKVPFRSVPSPLGCPFFPVQSLVSTTKLNRKGRDT